jgi:hypothetical protein
LPNIERKKLKMKKLLLAGAAIAALASPASAQFFNACANGACDLQPTM